MATRRHRTAAQKRATARLVAFNKSRRATNPRKRHHARRRNPIHVASAPRRSYHRRRNPIFSAPRRHRRRRNPISLGGMSGLLMPAVFGAAGAVLIDAAFTYIPLPASLNTGTMGLITKAGAALLLGTAGRKVFGAKATEMAVGSLTVQVYNLARQLLPASVTGLGYVSPGMIANAVPAAGSNPAALAGMGEYVPGVRVGGGMGLGEYVH